MHRLLPGLTGWAQVNGRDELGVPEKAGFDEYYLRNGSFLLDLRILAMTVLQASGGKGIKH